MKTLEDSFTVLLGKQPSDAERQALFRARDAFNIKNNDSLWLLLIILGHYETLYSKVPALIVASVASVSEKARTAAEVEFRAAGARVRSELAQSVAQAAREISDCTAHSRRSRWVAACFIIAASTLIAIGGLAFGAGRRSGFDEGKLRGYSTAYDEKAAAAWANTPEGQLAFALAKAGSIRELALCSGRGWKREGSYCAPRPEKNVVFGWRIGNKIEDRR